VSARAWPVAITLALAAVVVVNIRVAMIAGGDPSFAIEPDYYRKAVAWDSTMAQTRANQALQWTLTQRLGPFAADRGATLDVTLRDEHGAPISDAVVTVSALHIARATDVSTATLIHASAGDYVATLPVQRAGRWELRFEVTRGADRFTALARVDAVPAPAPRAPGVATPTRGTTP
jgi:nitrogen fixation protein FixH